VQTRQARIPHQEPPNAPAGDGIFIVVEAIGAVFAAKIEIVGLLALWLGNRQLAGQNSERWKQSFFKQARDVFPQLQNVRNGQVERCTPNHLLLVHLHGFESNGKTIVVRQKMSGHNVRHLKLASGFAGIRRCPGKLLGHAEGTNAERRRIAEHGDDLVR